jgi:hypothetical protein
MEPQPVVLSTVLVPSSILIPFGVMLTLTSWAVAMIGVFEMAGDCGARGNPAGVIFVVLGLAAAVVGIVTTVRGVRRLFG